jgi:hypothetical protein
MPEKVFFPNVPARGFEPLFSPDEHVYIEVGKDSVQAVVEHDLLANACPRPNTRKCSVVLPRVGAARFLRSSWKTSTGHLSMISSTVS